MVGKWIGKNIVLTNISYNQNWFCKYTQFPKIMNIIHLLLRLIYYIEAQLSVVRPNVLDTFLMKLNLSDF